MNKQFERYVKYGVVRNEEEWRELCQLTMKVVNALWPEDVGEWGVKDVLTRERIDLFNKFHIGFCEGCLFRNILSVMRMLHAHMDKEMIAEVMDMSVELINEIELENEASFTHL